MLTDGFSLAYATRMSAYTAGTAATWNRVADGIYVPSGVGTPDQPIKLVVKNGPPANNNLPTRFEVQMHAEKNAPIAGLSIPSLPADDRAIAGIYVNYVPRSFSEVDLYDIFCSVVRQVDTNWARLYRGEK